MTTISKIETQKIKKRDNEEKWQVAKKKKNILIVNIDIILFF